MKCNITARGVNKRDDLTQDGLAEQAECPDPDNEICCNEKEFISDFGPKSCLEVAKDGYRYSTVHFNPIPPRRESWRLPAHSNH